MPDAATVAAWASAIGAIFTVIVGCGMARLLWLQGGYNKLLRETLEVYDPKKVNERMRAFKESAEMVAQEEVKKREAQLAASQADMAKLTALFTEAATEAERVKGWLAVVLKNSLIDEIAFFASPLVPGNLKSDVQSYMDALPQPRPHRGGFRGAADELGADFPMLPPAPLGP